jgi:type IV secretion system protein VirB9
MRVFGVFLALLLLAPLSARSGEAPRPGAIDPRIQFVPYDPDQVVLLTGHFGYQMMIEFEADERIENVAIGDALGWQVTPNKRATLLFVKPIQKGAATNMTVVTDKRRYAFQLVAESPGSRDVMAYVVRFQYPEAAAAAEVAEAQAVAPAPESLNFAYSFKGARTIQPARVFDDGVATYFAWPAGVPAPAIFAIGPDGHEAMVNAQVRGDYTVVDQLAPTFMLRLGKAAVTVTNVGFGQPAAGPPPEAPPSAGGGGMPAGEAGR